MNPSSLPSTPVDGTWENLRKYVSNMKEYEENLKKYEGIYVFGKYENTVSDLHSTSYIIINFSQTIDISTR